MNHDDFITFEEKYWRTKLESDRLDMLTAFCNRYALSIVEQSVPEEKKLVPDAKWKNLPALEVWNEGRKSGSNAAREQTLDKARSLTNQGP